MVVYEDTIQTPTGNTMNVDQAATYLGISKATLYTWRTRRPGFGPRAVKAGGVLRYRKADLDVWIEAHAEPSNDSSPSSKGLDQATSQTSTSAPPERSMSRRSHPSFTHPRRAPAER